MSGRHQPENGADSEPINFRPGFNFPKPMGIAEMPEHLYDSLLMRFMAKVSVDTSTGCWEWTGAAGKNGYGRISIDGRTVRFAHRVSVELFVGPIPTGHEVDHLCRNHKCVNPSHLEPVTRRENLLRGDTFTARHAAKTHCPQGHAYDDTNTMRDRRNRRYCRACRAARRAA